MQVKFRSLTIVATLSLAAFAALPANTPATKVTGTALLGWSELGMQWRDAKYDVFSIQAPGSTIRAQLVVNGKLTRADTGVTVTYESVADAAGSTNATSAQKSDFWRFAAQLLGSAPNADVGSTGNAMPGTSNTPRSMTWDAATDGWVASDIPITSWDDSFRANPFPMIRLAARDAGGALLATTDIVVPVSAEADCRACHAPTGLELAKPKAGWSKDPDPQRAYRLDILRRHDDFQEFDPAYATALADAGYSPKGLYVTATTLKTPVLCARCHASEAQSAPGMTGVASLTAAMHRAHAWISDPATGAPLGDATDRAACFRCHPGTSTHPLRGAMTHATNADATESMECRSCHGSMTDLASEARRGWIDEPTCQQCHTGTAVTNAGQLRFLSAFDAGGAPRVAVDNRFATESDVPVAGASLYRASRGHGGLACQACHGATHAEFPSSHASDNVQSTFLQGAPGVIAECSTCHAKVPRTLTGGPHGMHPVGQQWVDDHPDTVQNTPGAAAGCADCHGTDSRGTALSRVRVDRTVTAFGTKSLFRGSEIGCWACHKGAKNSDRNTNAAPVALDAPAETTAATPVAIPLSATDTNGGTLTYRIVTHPAHGAVGLAANVATYVPDAGYAGADTFTFAARDTDVDSNLATVHVTVAAAATEPRPDVATAWKKLKAKRVGKKTKVDGYVLLSNVGDAPSAPWTLLVALSPDAAMHPVDTVLKSIAVPSLVVGKLRKVHVKLTLPAGTVTTGQYVLALANAVQPTTDPNAANDAAPFGPLR
ncbi:MAG: hypothetical protein K8T90_18735 [Planctomycetes bacterium]|nr:hypothetical protein [Planctomycetota bacterium]